MSADRHITSHVLCSERIAELEAVLLEAHTALTSGERALLSLEAELAALKAQYCDECVCESDCATLAAAYEQWDDIGDGGRDFGCNRWEARP